jgi:DNA-binding NtrC family response regulator
MGERKMKKRILIVEDDQSLARVTEMALTEEGYQVTKAKDGEAGLAAYRESAPDLILTDLQLPKLDGMAVLREVRQTGTVPVILMTAFGSISSAVEAMKLGAFDYITKPFLQEELVLLVAKALRMAALEEENRALRQELGKKYSLEAMVGKSPRMQQVFELIRKVAPSEASVLLLGESGTGKELAARAIHTLSARKEGPFVVVNCSAIPENLLESELFGHVKGAFTGASRDKVGKFEGAEHGTIFLDEVGEMSPAMQAKLLRAIAEREVEKVGGDRPFPVDVRVVSATNKDLQRAVKEGAFREDLFFRLHVVAITLPPLRDRKGDIPLLAAHFLSQSRKPGCGVDKDAMRILEAYDWPGNVRELENVLERALVLCGGDKIGPEHLPETLLHKEKSYGNVSMEIPEAGLSLEDLERALILEALERHGWNQSRAASFLGLTRPTLVYRMEKHGIKKIE